MTSDLVFRDIQPSQPLAFVRPGPERGITLPQSPHLSVGTPIVNRGPDFCQRLHSLLRSVDVFRQALARHAVIAEGIQCGGRHSVYGIRTNQFLYVENIAIVRIFGAGAGPEHALSLRSLGSQSLPALSAKDLLIAFIS